MKVSINLSKNGKITGDSLEKAIKNANNIRNLLTSGKLIKDFYTCCAETLIMLIQSNIDMLDIGSNLIDKLRSSWRYKIDISKDGTANIKIFTKNTRSSFIEFGTGIVGKEQPHPLAEKDNYQYDVDSKFKANDRSWWFGVKNYENRDIPESSIIDTDIGIDELIIRTKGAKGTMFAYNAFVDFVSTDMPKKIWEKVIKQNLGE